MSPIPGKGFLARVKQAGQCACFVGSVFLAGTVTSEEGTIDMDGWTPVETTVAGKIYHRAVEGSSIPRAMIVATFDVPPERVHAVVVDYEHFAEFIPNVFKSRIVAREGNVQWVYHHLQFPGPIADRVYLIRSTSSEHRSRQPYYRVEWMLDERPFPDIDLAAGVRPDMFSGPWELRSIGNSNTTEGRYAVHVEPGGFIPGWLVTGMTDRYIQQVMAAVRQRLEERTSRSFCARILASTVLHRDAR